MNVLIRNITMDDILMNIVKKQNETLIKKIAKKYGLNEEEMLRTYWTPTFYRPITSQK